MRERLARRIYDAASYGSENTAPSFVVLDGALKSYDAMTILTSKQVSATEPIASAAAQIAAGNLDLSSRTEQQASSLQQTAASMEQLTSTVRLNAENAQQASMLASNASDVAHEGNGAVGKVVGTMTQISERSTNGGRRRGLVFGGVSIAWAALSWAALSRAALSRAA